MNKSLVAVGVAIALTNLCACQPAKPDDDTTATSSVQVSSSVETSMWVKDVKSDAKPTSEVSLSQADVDAGAAEFVAAIKSKDFAALRTYYPADYPADELKPDAVDPSFVRERLRPIVNQGPIVARRIVTERDTGVFGILFYQKSVANRIDDEAYLESDAYMKTFFVCNFTRRDDGHWQVAHPILCYDETEGPYQNGSY